MVGSVATIVVDGLKLLCRLCLLFSYKLLIIEILKEINLKIETRKFRRFSISIGIFHESAEWLNVFRIPNVLSLSSRRFDCKCRLTEVYFFFYCIFIDGYFN